MRSSSRQADPDPPRHPLVAVVRVGTALLLLTGAAAVGFGGIGQAGGEARLVSETAAAGPPSEAGFAAPGQIVALTDRGVVALDAQTGAERGVLALAAPGDLQGLSVTPDGRQAYFASVDGEGTGSIRVVDTGGRTPPAFVAEGISPAVSPDGRLLAFAGPASPAAVCCNVVAVLDLRTGGRRTWSFDESDAADWLGHASLTKLAWAPDSRQLAFTLSYEGDTVAVLDTSSHSTLSQSVEVIVPGGGGDSSHPVWQATTGQIVVVNRAFECCFEDDYTGPVRTLSVDPAGGPISQVLPSGLAPGWLDFDISGRHLLWVEDGDLYRRSQGGEAVLRGAGVHAADW